MGNAALWLRAGREMDWVVGAMVGGGGERQWWGVGGWSRWVGGSDTEKEAPTVPCPPKTPSKAF